MFSATRSIRLRFSPPHCLQRTFAQQHHPRPHLTNRNFPRAPPRPPSPLTNRGPFTQSAPLLSAVDPVTFVVAFTLSAGVAYIATAYTQKQQSIDETEQQAWTSIAPSAQEELFHIMAPSMPPGRPGNLTADQETKLREMWLATLDVFGVSHEKDSRVSLENVNGTAGTETTPDAKKKKKSRLSLFKNKDKQAEDMAEQEGNDKHGQKQDFQQALASQSPEALRDAFWSMSKHDHPDALLLRFLRARKWDVHAALVMLVSTMHWRSQDQHVDDDIMKNGEGAALRESKSSNAAEKKEGEDFMAQLRMGKSFLHGTDKDGRPCCYVRVRLHKQGEQSEKSLEKFTVYTIETARMMLRPPVDTATIVFDMTDFSMANMDYTPVKFMIKCFEANYPESLGSVLVYKSPWIFQGIWKIIKGWLDPVVAAKVHFASNVDELSEWIPKSQILKELGGQEDFTYSYPEPVEGENAQMEDVETRGKVLDERKELQKSYEGETLSWAHGEDAGEGRNRLAQRLAENYWRLDPYVRARSLYDRTGVIGKEGRLDFYPSAKPAPFAAAGRGNDDLD